MNQTGGRQAGSWSPTALSGRGAINKGDCITQARYCESKVTLCHHGPSGIFFARDIGTNVPRPNQTQTTPWTRLLPSARQHTAPHGAALHFRCDFAYKDFVTLSATFDLSKRDSEMTLVMRRTVRWHKTLLNYDDDDDDIPDGAAPQQADADLVVLLGCAPGEPCD